MDKIKEKLINIFFPKFCLGCGREGSYLCEDCQACLDISENIFCLCEKPKILNKDGKCDQCHPLFLDGLYFPLSYQKTLSKKIIDNFRKEPYIRELSHPLAELIIDHFLLLEKEENFFKDKTITFLPITKNEEKKIGYNPNEEIAKDLSLFLEIPLFEYLEKKKKEIKTKKEKKIKSEKIFLVTTLYKKGVLMNKAAKILKENGAKEVWGIAVARSK
jgi:predicted amidophosphoribosyltransferase